MVKTTIDRNLLFGITAVQTGEISLAQMQLGFRQWIKDKSIPIADVFRLQGTLTKEQCRKLEILVDRELQQPIGRASDKREFNRRLAESLHGIVDESDLDVLHVGPLSIGPETDHCETGETLGMPTSKGRFRILRPYAKGGLGEVFVAWDEEIDREVALKQIQEKRADDRQVRDRFLREGEITGKLEHPGIVPVYGIGRDETGRPYYAMRLIRGTSMEEAIEKFHQPDSRASKSCWHSKALRGLLGCFIDVCEAMAYAHSRGVLHRDLKPSNIMLGRYGETLIVDWGLARIAELDEPQQWESDELPVQTQLDSGSSPTIAGTAVGTPAYMSPEQAKGRLDLLSPRSDVYSLGATLYSILTGQKPFNGSDVGEVLRNVSQGQFDTPRKVFSAIPKSLEAVCVKAMALKPDDRYETPLELASDIEAWLADSPVSAWPEPFSIRVLRWLKNHQSLVAGAAATIIVVLVSSLIASAFLSAKNTQLTQANKVAIEKTEIANQQSELSFETMTQVIQDFQMVFAQQPDAMTKDAAEARKKMLENAVKGMNKISKYLQKRTDYSDALVIAHLDLGQLYLSVGARDYDDGRGKAQAEFQLAMDVCQRWVAAEPENTKAQRMYAEVAAQLGAHAWFCEKIEEAVRWKQLAIETAKVLTNSPNQNDKKEAYRLLWINYYAIGTIEFRRFHLDDAIQWYRQALDLFKTIESQNIDVLDRYDREQNLPEIERRITIFSSLPKVREDVEFAFTLPADLIPRALYDCAAWQAFDGDHAAAFRTLQRMDSIKHLTESNYYSNACGFARCTKALLNGRALEQLSKQETELAEKYSRLSVETLYKAKEAGFFDDIMQLGLLARDPDLDVLRDRDDFQRFEAGFRE